MTPEELANTLVSIEDYDGVHIEELRYVVVVCGVQQHFDDYESAHEAVKKAREKILRAIEAALEEAEKDRNGEAIWNNRLDDG